MSARLRCWIHEDCVANPELGAACGPNVPDLPALDDIDRWSKNIYDPGSIRSSGLYEYGDGWDGRRGDGFLRDIDVYRNSVGDGSGDGDGPSVGYLVEGS